jgi:putative ABC transport system permease protein
MKQAFILAYKNIINKPLHLLLSLILFALGVGLISFLLLFSNQLKEKFEANLANIDLVIGAKGSPLQLILCNMYHIDNPTGNIKIKDARAFLNPRHPLIKKSIPLSLGDSYKNYRIVGTNHDILGLYKVELDKGALWQKDLEVTIGSQVAAQTGLKIGDSFMSSHGFNDDSDMAHDHAKFKVSGILKPSITVADQLIFTNTASIWAMHAHEENEEETHQEEEENHSHPIEEEKPKTLPPPVLLLPIKPNSNEDLLTHPEESITALLVQYKSKSNYQTLNMPRAINENTPMQAASPPYEINKLYSMIGTGTDAITYIGLLIALVSAISIFISLYKSLKERKYELSLLRVMGGSKSLLFSTILFEGAIIAIVGWAIGVALSHIGLWLLGSNVSKDFKYHFNASQLIKEEWYLCILSILLGIVAAILPAIKAARTDINKTLSEK